MKIDQFVVEATRKCNLWCGHCLRGNPQKYNLETHKLQSFLRGIDYIETLTISGGEVGLAIPTLKAIKQVLLWSDVNIGNIFMVTNGLYKTRQLAEMWLEFYDICYDGSVSALTFSFDRWHTESVEELKKTDYRRDHFDMVEDMFNERGIGDKVYKHTDEKQLMNSSLIAMGRARHIYGAMKLEPYKIEINEWDAIENEIYFSYDGMLFSSCNLSYSLMNSHSSFYIGTYQYDLEDQIEEYNNKIETLAIS